MDKIKLAVVEDNKWFRKGIINIMGQVPDFEVVFEATNGKEFIEKLKNSPVDVVLLDLQMPEMDGKQVTELLRKENQDIKIIILTFVDEEALIMQLMELGASGYLLKETDPEEVENAIRKVMATGHYFSDFVSKVMLRRMTMKDTGNVRSFNYKTDISDREVEVLKHICEGYTTTEIADKIYLSPRTVEGHRLRIMEKLGVKNTAGLVAFAIRNKIV